MAEAIRVNFGRPMPVFPLPDAVLLPHSVQPLHILEPRYKQMVSHCLDGAGQIAMASFAGEDWRSQYHGLPPLRPAVCIGQVIQHEPLSDGRHDIWLQGICRAKILKVIDPQDERLYRLVKVDPLEAVSNQPPPMLEIRQELHDLLTSPCLSRMRYIETVMELFDRDDISTHALLELIGFALLLDSELRYQLLAEANPVRRAGIIKHELTSLDDLVSRADRQPYRSWPKGMSWN
ncbi:MAG: LON peptidase substrate-binding domain-containing protein [Planctomycetota bacterium]|nr:LON peptidase substrate-binding domain-containing protein [Planctomycetota bacterium]MCZ6543266.1 LON peptidase substrate-binding domain-containing protein [Planctomycetota bacterium]MCZ6612028.1 LON peptidase substrate-binding domain-containing protein [Planctomycetota bacterium]MCZ6734727.1 LON peptidase substrate-binding domain-containing protein [Planctomycetota bacterium]